MGEIQYKTFTHNAVEHQWISQKMGQQKPYFSYKHEQNYIYVYKSYDIQKVKNALVIYVCTDGPENIIYIYT
jgi:hypothetical protein